MRLSLKLASDPDGRSLEGPEHRVAPLTALELGGTRPRLHSGTAAEPASRSKNRGSQYKE